MRKIYMRENKNTTSQLYTDTKEVDRPFLLIINNLLITVGSIGLGGYWLFQNQTFWQKIPSTADQLQAWLLISLIAGLGSTLLIGLWKYKNWARTGISFLFLIGLVYFLTNEFFTVATAIFAGNKAIKIKELGSIVFTSLVHITTTCSIPLLLLIGLLKSAAFFNEAPAQRRFIDRTVRYFLFATALSAVLIVFLIIIFTISEAMPAIEKIGLENMLLGTIWRPGSATETQTLGQFGLIPMIVGSIYATLGATLLGVPLSIGAAILLAEVAPKPVREVVRPAVELLAGIPSVVYGLFGMVVLAPLVRNFEVPQNTGFGILTASIVLAVMIIPTITNIAEDAIRAVPHNYKEGSLALGATHWQTIYQVILPSARSGLMAAIILGIGRALGETMAVIMVIGNSIAMPAPLDNNLLTLVLSTTRTLTGNIAVEINYASGVHRSALFFTGVLLFIMIMSINSIARSLMRERSTQ
jgi:phosphate transport system permease protein